MHMIFLPSVEILHTTKSTIWVHFFIYAHSTNTVYPQLTKSTDSWKEKELSFPFCIIIFNEAKLRKNMIRFLDGLFLRTSVLVFFLCLKQVLVWMESVAFGGCQDTCVLSPQIFFYLFESHWTPTHHGSLKFCTHQGHHISYVEMGQQRIRYTYWE